MVTSCVFLRINQTLIAILWESVRVPAAKCVPLSLSLNEVTPKSVYGQIIALQPRQQILCMCLFGERDSEQDGVRDCMCAQTPGCVQIIECMTGE